VSKSKSAASPSRRRSGFHGTPGRGRSTLEVGTAAATAVAPATAAGRSSPGDHSASSRRGEPGASGASHNAEAKHTERAVQRVGGYGHLGVLAPVGPRA
jgi:hypothetical protein